MNGRVLEAAHLFITAAVVAKELHKYEMVAHLARRAEMLCNCPLMDPAEADAIHQRIAYTGQLRVVRR